MYYLLSRYYDPQTGRFINADTPDYLDPKTINGLNLYSYCNNNPVMNVDPTGHKALSQDTISDIISAVALVLMGLVIVWTAFQTPNQGDGADLNITFDADPPDFNIDPPVMDKNGLKLVNANGFAWRGYMYLDSGRSSCFYISLGNISAFLGAYFNNDTDLNLHVGGGLSANLIEIGYDGPYMDLALPLVGVGVKAELKNGKIILGVDLPKYPGLEFAIDPIAISKVLMPR